MPDPVLWELDDHTRAKHRVLRAYLDAWLPVMGQQALKFRDGADPPRLLLVDGFAGPGRYSRGEPGSRLIFRTRAVRITCEALVPWAAASRRSSLSSGAGSLNDVQVDAFARLCSPIVTARS